MLFADYTDFCCLALGGPRLEIGGNHTLMSGLTVSDSPGVIDLDETWVQWLGTLQADSFKNSSLFILAQTQHTLAGGDAGVRLNLEKRTRLLHNALVLKGCGYNSSMLMIGGTVLGEGHLHVGPIRSGLTPSFRPDFRLPKRISSVDLVEATTMLTGLEHIYEHVPDRPYRRLRKGFNLWIRGAEEGYDLNERLHFFVRSIEAIIRPTIAARRDKKGKKPPWRQVTSTFKSRGERLIGRSTRNARLLQELYALRSSIEHVQDVMPKVRQTKGVERARAYQFRALQCEVLASTIYSRILTNSQLREQLRSEQGVEGFWNRNSSGFAAVWGEKLDLDAAALQEFVRANNW